MSAIALGPILILLGAIVGVIALVAVAVGRRKRRGAGAVFATIFGLLFLGSVLLGLFAYRVPPSAPRAVVVSSSSNSDSETIVAVDEVTQLNATPQVDGRKSKGSSKSKSNSTKRSTTYHKPSKKVKTITHYGFTDHAIENRWPQQILSVAILMVMACLLKVVADGRLGRRFSTIARVGAGMLACALAVVVFQLGPIHF